MYDSPAIAETEVITYLGISYSRQDHAKGARPRARGGDALGRVESASRQAISPLVRSTSVLSMPPSLTAPLACLAWRLHDFATNRHE
jgi:hypothetical protein